MNKSNVRASIPVKAVIRGGRPDTMLGSRIATLGANLPRLWATMSRGARHIRATVIVQIGEIVSPFSVHRLRIRLIFCIKLFDELRIPAIQK